MMRFVFVVILIAYCNSLLHAQEFSGYRKLFGSEKENGVPSRSRLIEMKSPTTARMLTGEGFHVLRQLSKTIFIVASGTGNKPAVLYETPANDNWKLSPHLLNTFENADVSGLRIRKYLLYSSFPAQLFNELSPLKAEVKIEYSFSHGFVISTTPGQLQSLVLPLTSLAFVDAADRTPKEDLAVNSLDLSTNKVNLVHHENPAINGAGVTVSVNELRPDTTDIDLKGRYLSSPLAASSMSGHATIMSTIISGAGNSHITGKGVAWGSSLLSSDFSKLLPDADADYKKYSVSVQNHSYGTAIENYYGADAAAFDGSTVINPSLLHVFSSGNSGLLKSTTGRFANVEGYANITGSFKMSKNSISVGAVDSFGNVAAMSSKGPAYDGRIKPELVAFGEDGSSGAAAIVSGVALLCQQAYKEKHNGTLPEAALMKAILANTADDVAGKGIDYQSGFGNVNAYRALQTVSDLRFWSGSITGSGAQVLPLTIPSAVKNLRITLAWTDPAAPANAFSALVNDLDLELVNLNTYETWNPWVLNDFAAVSSLSAASKRGRDSLNNIEQVSIDDAAAGNYEIRISGNHLANSQSFFVTWQWDETEYFKWTYPTASDNLLPGSQSVIRWETAIPQTGVLEYSGDGGMHWLAVIPSVDLSKKQLRLLVPDSFHLGVLRTVVDGKTFVSDTFQVSAPPALALGFNCPDSLQWIWNGAKGRQYVLYHLGDRYMEVHGLYTDSVAIIKKAVQPYQYYAVAPYLTATRVGARSYALNYANQGVGCYLVSFLADKENDVAKIHFQLSSLYNIRRIDIAKFSGNQFTMFRKIEPVNDYDYALYDSLLLNGLNTYRLQITFDDGRVMYSQPESVFKVATSEVIFFPNPIASNSSLNILSGDPDKSAVRLYSMDGRMLAEKKLNETLEKILMPSSKGIYFAEILKAGKRDAIRKIVVY